jgi:hypothetical protein
MRSKFDFTEDVTTTIIPGVPEKKTSVKEEEEIKEEMRSKFNF